MAEYLIQDSSLIAIANAVREKTGKTGLLTPQEIEEEILSLQYYDGASGSLPVLDDGYPQDIKLIAGETDQMTLNIVISMHGNPNVYSYQWYIDGIKIDGATNESYVFTDSTSIGVKYAYCIISNEVGNVTSRTATITIESPIPRDYSYSGTAVLTIENDYDWYLTFKNSGTLTLPRDMSIDVFCCGGGGAGGNASGGGGGGGYTTNAYGIPVLQNTSYDIVIGSGGSGRSGWDTGHAASGGATTAFGYTANGGQGGGGVGNTNGKGGNGGSGGGYGGVNNRTAGASNGNSSSGTGQGRTTKAFEGTYTNDLYGSGGGGAGNWQQGSGYAGTLSGGGGWGWYAGTRYAGQSAAANTGAGGGGASDCDWNSGSGGSGIVIIRNAR